MFKQLFTSLRARLMLIVMLAVLPALAIILYGSAREARRETEQARAAVGRLTRDTAAELERFVEGARQVLILLAKLREVRGNNSELCNRVLAELCAEFPQYLNFGVVQTNGELFASARPAPADVNLRDRVWLLWVLRTGKFGFGHYQVGRITGQPSLNFVYPVLTGAPEVSRVVFAALDLNWFNQELQQRQLPEDTVLTVFDAEGTVLARKPGAAEWLGKRERNAALIEKMLAEGNGTAELSGVDGVRRLYAFTKVHERCGTMYVAAGMPVRAALGTVFQHRRNSLVLLAVVAVAALATAWYVGGAFVVKPVRALRDAVRQLEAGDLSVRVQPTAATGELAELTEAFNQMAQALEERMSERIRAADALRQSAQRLSLHFYQTPLGVIEWDLEFRVTRWNPAAERIFGFTEEEARGRTAAELIVPAAVRPHVDRVWRALLERKGGTRSTNENVTKDGRTIVCEWYNTPLVDATGQVIGVTSQVEDITKERQAAEEIRQLNAALEQRVRERTAELEAANKELEAFSYSVSHDLRAPLRAIDAFSHALLEDCGAQLNETGHAHLQRVFAATQRMARLIDALLKLSRVARAELNKEDLNLSELARRVVDELRQAQPDRSVEVVIAPEMRARADAALLTVVLENLLGNAWKFTGKTAAPRIEFGQTTAADGTAVYFVRDNGAGFDMAQVGKLFGAFQRLHNASEFPGEGIGLATVQRIIQRHRGRVWAEGSPGQGATFYFTLGARD